MLRTSILLRLAPWRHFSGVQEPRSATAARVAASECPILILQDTTEFIYSRAQPGKIGFTKTINSGRYKAGQPNMLTLCGVLMHSSLAVTLTGTPSVWRR